METRWKVTGPVERSRTRRLVVWLAAIFALLLLPTLWLLTREARPADVRPVAESPARSEAFSTISEPTIPEPTIRERTKDVRAAREEGPVEDGCDDLRVIVDRKHALPADYAPDDLVSLRDLGLPILGREALLRRGAAENLERLVAAAAAEGEALVVASAYRSYADQDASHARLVSIYGKNADKTSAPPGHSQHQLGTAVDFTSADVGYEVVWHFGRTTASRWLLDHAQDYGFVLAYPRGQEEETGFRWEPWHYRYVGVANAREIRRSNLALQEFLSREGVVPRC